MKENSGLTNVHTVDYIKQTVLIERQRVGDGNISRYEMVVPTEQPQVDTTPLNVSVKENNGLTCEESQKEENTNQSNPTNEQNSMPKTNVKSKG